MQKVKTTKTEFIKGAIYTAQNQHQSVLNGDTDYDSARKTVLKFMNFGLKEGQYYNMMEYFDSKISGAGDVMKNKVLLESSKKEAWEALEYFDLI